MNKLEIVKNHIGAMTVEQIIQENKLLKNTYHIRFRKSKSNKVFADQFEKVLQDENFKGVERFGDYEFFIMGDEAINHIYDMHMNKIMSREF